MTTWAHLFTHEIEAELISSSREFTWLTRASTDYSDCTIVDSLRANSVGILYLPSRFLLLSLSLSYFPVPSNHLSTLHQLQLVQRQFQSGRKRGLVDGGKDARQSQFSQTIPFFSSRDLCLIRPFPWCVYRAWIRYENVFENRLHLLHSSRERSPIHAIHSIITVLTVLLITRHYMISNLQRNLQFCSVDEYISGKYHFPFRTSPWGSSFTLSRHPPPFFHFNRNKSRFSFFACGSFPFNLQLFRPLGNNWKNSSSFWEFFLFLRSILHILHGWIVLRDQ